MKIKESKETEGNVTVSLTREVVGNMRKLDEQLSLGPFVFQVSVARPAPHDDHQASGVVHITNDEASGSYVLRIQKLASVLATHLCMKYGGDLDPDECAKLAAKAFVGLCTKLNEDGTNPVTNQELI